MTARKNLITFPIACKSRGEMFNRRVQVFGRIQAIGLIRIPDPDTNPYFWHQKFQNLTAKKIKIKEKFYIFIQAPGEASRPT